MEGQLLAVMLGAVVFDANLGENGLVLEWYLVLSNSRCYCKVPVSLNVHA